MAFLDAVRRSIRPIRSAIGATTINPDLLTCAERLQYEGYLRREETTAAILVLVKGGVAIRQIVRRTGHSRKLVRQVVRGERTDVFRVIQSTIEAHLPYLDTQWASGCRNSAEHWRRLRVQGFRGSSRVVGELVTRRRRAEQATDQQLQKVPSARTIARLMTTARDHLSKADAVTIAAIEAQVPTLVDARTLIERFHAMIRKKVETELETWITDASSSLVASFASGITRDAAAVRAAITEPWSNGQVEGQITKLKLVKRLIYVRAKIELLQARLIGAARDLQSSSRLRQSQIWTPKWVNVQCRLTGGGEKKLVQGVPSFGLNIMAYNWCYSGLRVHAGMGASRLVGCLDKSVGLEIVFARCIRWHAGTKRIEHVLAGVARGLLRHMPRPRCP